MTDLQTVLAAALDSPASATEGGRHAWYSRSYAGSSAISTSAGVVGRSTVEIEGTSVDAALERLESELILSLVAVRRLRLEVGGGA